MNSKTEKINNQLIYEINTLRNTINRNKDINKEELFKLKIIERLDKSLNEYYNKISKTLDNLYYNDNNDLKILKQLNKGNN